MFARQAMMQLITSILRLARVRFKQGRMPATAGGASNGAMKGKQGSGSARFGDCSGAGGERRLSCAENPLCQDFVSFPSGS